MFEVTIKGGSVQEVAQAAANLANALSGNASADRAETPRAPAPKPAAPKPAAPKAPALSFKDDVGPLILKIADKSRDKAVELLGQFGVAKGTELKPEQFAEFIEAANAALEELELV